MSMLLALLIGTIISIMVTINGNLTGCLGAYTASMVIHGVGTMFALILCVVLRKPVFRKWDVPLWAYCGGAFGIVTSLCQSSSYGHITMTSIVALGLLGQSIASTILDGFGFLGMKKRKIGWSSWIGLLISCAGVGIMLDPSVTSGVIAVGMSMTAGVTIVVTRTINARLAKEAGPLVGSWYNHVIGLCCSILLWFVMSDTVAATVMITPKPWMFFGGMLGVFSVLLFNIAVPRLSAFRLSLLSFLGQMFTGFVVDMITGQDISGKKFWGSLVCAGGFLVTLLIDIRQKKKQMACEKMETDLEKN